MNYIDFIIIILLVLGLARGFTEGFIKELASLLALILGIWGAIKFSSYTSAQLYNSFDMSGKYIGVIAFMITFIIIVIIVHLIGLLIDRLVDTMALGFLNRLLGLAFGLFKNALILSVIIVILNTINTKRHFLPNEAISHSKLYNPVAKIAPAIFPIIAEGNFDNSFNKLKKKPEGNSI